MGLLADHIRKLVESGELRAFRVGTLWRIRAEAVDEFEARPAVSPPSPQPAPKEDPNPALTSAPAPQPAQVVWIDPLPEDDALRRPTACHAISAPS